MLKQLNVSVSFWSRPKRSRRLVSGLGPFRLGLAYLARLYGHYKASELNFGVTILTCWSNVTSSVTWPSDWQHAVSRWPIIAMRQSCTVKEIWNINYFGDHDHQNQGHRRPRRAGGQPRTWGQSVGRGRRHPPPKFWAVGKSSSCQKFFVEKCKLWSWKTLILGKFRVKIEILSIHGLLCRTFAAVCRNYVGNFQCLSENSKFLSRLLF